MQVDSASFANDGGMDVDALIADDLSRISHPLVVFDRGRELGTREWTSDSSAGSGAGLSAAFPPWRRAVPAGSRLSRRGKDGAEPLEPSRFLPR